MWYGLTAVLVFIAFMLGGHARRPCEKIDVLEHDLHATIEEKSEKVVIKCSHSDSDDVMNLWQIIQGDNLETEKADLPISLGKTIQGKEPTYWIDIPRTETKCPECGEFTRQSH